MDEKELMRYIQGQSLTDQEIASILDWIEVSDENRTTYNELKHLWVLSGLAKVTPLKSSKFFNHSSSRKILKLPSIHQYLKYAAIFIIAFLAGCLAWQYSFFGSSHQLANVYNEVYVPKGEKSLITLYDGTEVWLNAGTRFKYPVIFDSEQRNVYLDGEAYFSVTHSDEKPFLVNTGELKVKVLGTKFNVYAYADESIVSTTLEEGLVEVSTDGRCKGKRITPGQQISYSKSSGEYEIKAVETGLFTCWKENKLRFDNAELAEILKKMERWYDVKMNIDADIDTSDRYTITIKTESLKEMLEVLSITTNINYKIETDVVRISKK
ncbi:FecR family protein [Sunxiuqinia sp. sy24]|uniref:FecR family protein n=1 Tax=Sunxiuqinia sp. sy24 TaxID=3461495 RepID=UPI0040458ACF